MLVRWFSVYLPLTSFDRGSYIGQVCTDCQIDFSSVIEMDIYVLFQGGPFEVLVKQITAVTDEQSFPSPSITLSSTDEIKKLIDETTQSGGALYNYGYYELCIAIYRSVLNTLLAANNSDHVSETAPSIVSERIKNIICQGLQRSQIGSKTDMAWTLRYTLDALVEEMRFALPSSSTGSAWRPDAAAVGGYQCSGVTSGAYNIVMSPTNSPSTAAKPTSSPSLVTLNSTTTIPPPTLITPTPSLSSTVLPTIQSTITPSLPPSITATVGQSTPDAKDSNASDQQDTTSFSSANEIDNKMPTSSSGRSYSSRFALLIIAVMLLITTCDAFVGNSCYHMQKLISSSTTAQSHLLSSPSNEEQEQTQRYDITTLPPPPELKRVPLPVMLAGGLFLFATSVPSSQRGLADQILQLAQDALRADALVLMELGPGLEAGNVYALSYARSQNVDQLVLQFQINGGNAWAQGIGYGIQDENGVKLISLEVANMDAVLNNQSFRLDIQ
jgi:predicted lactoylglutathione lyase